MVSNSYYQVRMHESDNLRADVGSSNIVLALAFVIIPRPDPGPGPRPVVPS